MAKNISDLENKLYDVEKRLNKKNPETISFIVYESETMRLQSMINLCLKLLFLSFAAIVIVVISFLLYLGQYNIAEYDQSGDGNNINHDIRGDVTNGTTINTQN